jgi:hypothetical protein
MRHTFQGRPDMVEALDDAGGTPSEYTAQHPESEAAQVFADGIGFGIGFGKRVYSDRPRAPGANRLCHVEWRDPRWLWRNPISLQWYETKRDGMRPIYPGDGETILFCPYPDLDVWRHGPWLYMTLAGIFERDSEFDRQRVSEVTTPTPVMRAEKPTTKEARKQALAELKELAHDHRIVLPEQWLYEIVSAEGTYNDITTAIVDWATGMVEVGLTGNLMGLKAQSAFTDANVYRRTTTDRRRFYARAWCRTVREQSLVYWGEDNYLDRNVPVIHIDVESPEDKLKAAEALEQEGAALKSIRDGADAVGFDVDPGWVQERAQARGYRLIRKAGPAQVTTLDLGVEQVGAVVRGIEARASQGLPPFGDDRDGQTVADLLNAGKAGPQKAPTAGQPPAPPSAAASPDQRRPEPEEDEDDGDEDAYRLAAERAQAMNAAGLTACRHNRTNLCRTCMVRGHWMPVEGGWRVTWQAAARMRRAA